MELKVRAWNKEKKIMVSNNEDDEAGYWDGIRSNTVDLINSQLDWHRKSKHGSLIFMLYTGLKDKNGKEIYKGDIVEYKYKSNDVIKTKTYIINYQLGCFVCTENNGNLSSSLGYYTTLVNGNGLEIIGNIYENPELLQGDE